MQKCITMYNIICRQQIITTRNNIYTSVYLYKKICVKITPYRKKITAKNALSEPVNKVECTIIAGLFCHAFISAFCTFIVVWEPVSELLTHCYHKCNNLALGVIGTVDIKSLILQLPIKLSHTRTRYYILLFTSKYV